MTSVAASFFTSVGTPVPQGAGTATQIASASSASGPFGSLLALEPATAPAGSPASLVATGEGGFTATGIVPPPAMASLAPAAPATRIALLALAPQPLPTGADATSVAAPDTGVATAPAASPRPAARPATLPVDAVGSSAPPSDPTAPDPAHAAPTAAGRAADSDAAAPRPALAQANDRLGPPQTQPQTKPVAPHPVAEAAKDDEMAGATAGAPAPATGAPAARQKANRAPSDPLPDAPTLFVLAPSPSPPMAAVPVAPPPAALPPAPTLDAKPGAGAAPAIGSGLASVAGQPAMTTDQRVSAIGGERGDAPSGGADQNAASHQDTPAPRDASAEPVALHATGQALSPSVPHPVAAQGNHLPAPAPIPTITAQPGRIGQEMGVAIAHHIASGDAGIGGGDTITLRLNPVDMGRIEVKLSFDEGGTLRALVSADSPAALDMLRRDSADLGRALADAGVRSDTQTLRFETRADMTQSGGQNAGQSGRHDDQSGQRQAESRAALPDDGRDVTTDITDESPAAYRPLRSRGRVDMVA